MDTAAPSLGSLVDAERLRRWLEEAGGGQAGSRGTRGTLRPVHVSSSRRVFNRRHIPGAVYCDIHRQLAGRGRAAETGDVEREWLLPSRAKASDLLARWAIGTTDEIVFYDDVGQNRHAIRGYWLLRLYRFPRERLHVLDGGLAAWMRAGGAVNGIDDDTPPPEPRPPALGAVELGERDASLIAATEQVLGWSREAAAPGGPTRLLDVRTPDEFLGRDVRALRGGHVPGARQRLFTDFLAADGTLRPANEILDLLRAGGVEPAEVRATYCQGGVRAALAWFALHEVAGLVGVRNYAGSWEEWGNRPELPVTTLPAERDT